MPVARPSAWWSKRRRSSSRHPQPSGLRAEYRGHEGFLANIGELTEVFDDFKIEPGHFDDRDERIMVAVRVSGRGKTSGASIEGRLFHVWTIVDQHATRLEVHSDRDAAIAALTAP